MLIRAYSDLHGFLPYVEPCDVLLLAGDIVPTSGHMGGMDPEIQTRFVNEVFCDWCESLEVGHILITPGHFDFVFQKQKNKRKYELAANATILIDREFQVPGGGPKVWGSPWGPVGDRFAFHATDKILEKRAAEIPADCDIWLYHYPPVQIKRDSDLDLVSSRHEGNVWLTRRIAELQPRLCVCGALHNDYGQYTVAQTTVLNVSFVGGAQTARWRHGEIIWDEEIGSVAKTELVSDDPARGLYWMNRSP